ncbi:MAG: hypothetical protein EBZ55_01280 [Actinobacteria bacterium]|nr:hypothetical protein [Actinomycetota bacterium]
MSRSSPLFLIVLVGLLGCARDPEANTWRPTSAEIGPISAIDEPVPTPTVDSQDAMASSNSRTAITRDFATAISERIRCGERPDRCAITQITKSGSEYRSFLTNLMTERIEAGFRTLPGIGEFRYRIESIEVTDIGRAVVHTCSLDSVVLFDLGHSNDAIGFTTNPIIVDDAVVSARTRWEIALESGRWKWVSARGTEMNMEEDLCGFDVD